MKTNPIIKITSVAALFLMTGGMARAYDPNWSKDQADSYSWHGLNERYVFGGDKGWINNDGWDSPTTEGVDCSSYVPRCWAIDGSGQTFLGEHTAGGHPYSTASFYPLSGYTPPANTTAISQSSCTPYDCWVYRTEGDPDAPGEHMGLVESMTSSTIYTREARGSDYGVVRVARSRATLADYSARYRKRNSWGGSGQSGGANSTFMTGPLVLKNQDGRLEVFMVGANKALYHKYQTTVNGGWNSGWASLGGTIKKGFCGLLDYQGLIHIFAVDDVTTKVFHIRQTAPNGGWTTWVELKPTGGTSANVSDGLACLSKANGRIMVFGVNADTREINRCMQATPGATDWSSWNVVGAGGDVLNGFAVINDYADQAHVFAIDDVDYGLRHIRQNPDATWTPWVNMGGDNNREVSVFGHTDGRLRVYCRNRLAKTVSGWAQGSAGGTWSGPVTISSTTVNKGLCVVTDALTGDYPHIFAVNDSTTAGLHIRLQSGGTWTPWVGIGGDLKPRVTAIKNVQATPTLEAYAISSSGGTMYRVVQSSTGTWPNYSAFSTPLP